MSVLLSSIFGKDVRTQLGVLLLDCLLTEEIAYESQVTLYPVETGVQITDHITQGTRRVTISGVIATKDISAGFGFSTLFEGYAGNQAVKLIDIVEALDKMHADRALVDIYTGQLVYTDMAFTNLNLSRSNDGGGGNWANVRAELIKINKVKLKTADVPATETTAEPATGRSGETNKPAGKSSSSSSGKSSGDVGPQQSGRDSSIAKKLLNRATEVYNQ